MCKVVPKSLILPSLQKRSIGIQYRLEQTRGGTHSITCRIYASDVHVVVQC